MQRITVAILEWTWKREYSLVPYVNISGASIIYYPGVSDEALEILRIGTPEQIQQILSTTANL
jgi:hypothetical protein